MNQVVIVVWQPEKVNINKIDPNYLYLAVTNYWVPQGCEIIECIQEEYDLGGMLASPNTLTRPAATHHNSQREMKVGVQIIMKTNQNNDNGFMCGHNI